MLLHTGCLKKSSVWDSMGTEIFKIEEEMIEKMMHKVDNPSFKNG